MATSGADVNPYNSFGTSLEQFRSALTSQVGRRNLGLELSDEQARAIAADPALSEVWYKSWRDGAAQYDWQRELPVRFNAPPGWPYPSQDWILQHIGLEMSDEWRPPGAPPDDPPGWTWWIPQEPAWTAWVNSHNAATRMLPAVRTVFGVCTGLALALSLAGWSLLLIFAILFACLSGVGLLVTMANDRHFRKDPLGELRDDHLQVAGRLKIGRPVGDGHTLGMADYWDSGGWFDGE